MVVLGYGTGSGPIGGHLGRPQSTGRDVIRSRGSANQLIRVGPDGVVECMVDELMLRLALLGRAEWYHEGSARAVDDVEFCQLHEQRRLFQGDHPELMGIETGRKDGLGRPVYRSLGELLARDADVVEKDRQRLPLNCLKRTREQRKFAKKLGVSLSGEGIVKRDSDDESEKTQCSSLCSIDRSSASPGRIKMFKQCGVVVRKVLNNYMTRAGRSFDVEKGVKEIQRAIRDLPNGSHRARDKESFKFIFLEQDNRRRINTYLRDQMKDFIGFTHGSNIAQKYNGVINKKLGDLTHKDVDLIDSEDNPTPRPRWKGQKRQIVEIDTEGLEFDDRGRLSAYPEPIPGTRESARARRRALSPVQDDGTEAVVATVEDGQAVVGPYFPAEDNAYGNDGAMDSGDSRDDDAAYTSDQSVGFSVFLKTRK